MAKALRQSRFAKAIGLLKPRRRARPLAVNRNRLRLPFEGFNVLRPRNAADKILLLKHLRTALQRIADPKTPREQRAMLLREWRREIDVSGELNDPDTVIVAKGRGRHSFSGLNAKGAKDLLRQAKDGKLAGKKEISKAIQRKVFQGN